MAVSRLLHAVAACVILLSFAAGLRKSYWSGCMKAATVICQQIFSILALVIFLLKILLKSASKSSFFRSGVERSGFGATISDAIARSSLVFCNSVSADRIGMAASRSFEGSLARNAFLALVIFLLKILLKSASKSSFFRSGVEIHPVLELQFPTPLRVVLLCFATQSPQIAL